MQRELRRRALKTPETYDAKEFIDKERIDMRVNREFEVEYVVNVNVKAWVNKLVVLKDGHRGDFKRSVLVDDGLSWVEDMVTEAVAKQVGNEDTSSDRMLVSVKSLNTRGTAVDQYIDDFGATALATIVKLADSQYFNYTRHPVRINFEIRVKCAGLTEVGKPRHPRVESVTPTPAPSVTPDGGRNDRSAQLRRINAADRRVDGYAMRATVIEDLHKHWRCTDPHCPNERNFCYFDGTDRLMHYKLDYPNIESWAYAVERGDPGIDIFTIPLDTKTLLRRKGPVQRGSATPLVPTKAQLLKQKQEELEAMELELRAREQQDKLARMQERLDSWAERREALDEERERREAERFEAELSRRRQEAVRLAALSPPPPTYSSHQDVRPSSHLPPARQPPTRVSPPHASSPIESQEDDLDLAD